MTLGEPIEDILTLQQGDKPLLEATLYDYDGTAWDEGYTATFIVGRSESDTDEWVLSSIVGVSPEDNVFYFNLEDITYTRGIYQGYVLVENATETTPVSDVVKYSFKPVRIEVI